jgi:MFS transporter, DHA2 family, multidrug resistance protein
MDNRPQSLSTPQLMTSHANPLLNTSPKRKAFIIITVMCVAILEVLDSTIVNVALPHMMPALNANADQITWVLTSYLVASAMMIPLTGFLSRRWGERRLLLTNTSGFMISSLLCGTATTLSSMVFLRCCQGAFGAALIPLSQSILKQSFPKNKQGKAMAIWGMGVLVAPVLGPTLGGLITENSSWRWIFYINLPICAIALILAFIFIPKVKSKRGPIDIVGILLMFIGVGCLQIFLDQGNNHDWFHSQYILTLLIISVISLVLFVQWSLQYSKPAVQIKLFSNRNFRLSTICLAIFCGTQFGILTLEPIMLERLFNYSALAAGLTLMPMGLCSALSVGFCSNLFNKMPIKYILIIGAIFSIIGSHYVSTLTLQSNQAKFVIANMIMGFGMGFFMVPLSVYALSNIPEDKTTDGAGLYSYGRMLGSSIGISLLSTLCSRETQINNHHFIPYISPYNLPLHFWLTQHQQTLKSPQTLAILQQLVTQQSAFRAYLDAFFLCSICFASMIPLMLLMKHVKLNQP